MHMHDGHHSINVLIGRIKKIWIYMRNKDYLLPMKIFRRYEDIQELEGPQRKYSVIICNFIWDIFGNQKTQNRQERDYKKTRENIFCITYNFKTWGILISDCPSVLLQGHFQYFSQKFIITRQIKSKFIYCTYVISIFEYEDCIFHKSFYYAIYLIVN